MLARFFLCSFTLLVVATGCRGGSGDEAGDAPASDPRSPEASHAEAENRRRQPASPPPASTSLQAPRAEKATDAAPAKVSEGATTERSPLEVRVRRGESMGRYGAWARIPMPDLYERVGLGWNERLAPGRLLKIPLDSLELARFQRERQAFHQRRRARYSSLAKRPYRVRAGDNAWRIARRRGVPLWLLEELNGGRDLRRLQVGDKIVVPAPRRSPGDS